MVTTQKNPTLPAIHHFGFGFFWGWTPPPKVPPAPAPLNRFNYMRFNILKWVPLGQNWLYKLNHQSFLSTLLGAMRHSAATYILCNNLYPVMLTEQT